MCSESEHEEDEASACSDSEQEEDEASVSSESELEEDEAGNPIYTFLLDNEDSTSDASAICTEQEQ